VGDADNHRQDAEAGEGRQEAQSEGRHRPHSGPVRPRQRRCSGFVAQFGGEQLEAPGKAQPTLRASHRGTRDRRQHRVGQRRPCHSRICTEPQQARHQPQPFAVILAGNRRHGRNSRRDRLATAQCRRE
jgi:hypothetical protein